MKVHIGCFLLILFFFKEGYSQDLNADFQFDNSACLNQNLRLTNLSSGATEYEWDFCTGTFNILESEEISSLPNSARSLGLSLIEGTEGWYGFATSRDNNSLIRFFFGNGVEQEPTLIENLGNVSGLLDKPVSISLISENNNFYALIHNWGNRRIIRVSFSTSLMNIPNATVALSNIGNSNSSMAFGYSNDSLIVVVNNFISNSLSLINFGNDINTNPTATDIINTSGFSGISLKDISLIKDKDKWYGFVPSLSNSKIFRLDFGNSLYSNTITSEEIVSQGFGSDKPASIQVVREINEYFLLINTNNQGNLYRAKIGKNIKSKVASTDVLKIANGFGVGYDLSFIKDKSHWFGFLIDDLNSKLYRLNFIDSCNNVSLNTSLEKDSILISYSKSGKYFLELVAKENHITSVKVDSITVLTQEPPEILITEENICSTSQSISLSVVSDAQLTWKWDIGQNSYLGNTVVFPNQGSENISVVLEGLPNKNECGQILVKDITIYEPPESKFGVDQAVICTNGAIAFQNRTDTKGADEIISYAWDFNGEGSATEANPSFTFTTGGSKTVSLTASIPGCSSTYDTTFTVQPGPTVNFNQPPQICQGQEITFENLTSGEGITGYRWSFGDGGTYTSTALESPEYVYDSAGTYIAMLEVNNVNGCANTLSKTITIYARPQAAFTADIACAGAPTQFVDESTTGINSNVIAWSWDFGDGQGRAQVRNPQYTYAMPGTYEVSLMVLTSAGCTDTLVQEIVVESAVQADFSSVSLCPTESTPYGVQFNDLSFGTHGDQISEWLWTINGENFVIANPTYTFAAPGTYQVSLTVFSETACNASVTKNITIETPPIPDFDFAVNCAGNPLSFSNQSVAEEAEISRYIWDFAGLGISYEEHPAFVFEAAGNYGVNLTLETAEGCRYSIRKEVVIPAAPQAAFTADITYGGTPLTVNFTNSSTGGVRYLWNFGGEGESNEENPSFIFTKPGTYTVSLQVEDALGCTHTFTKQIKVVVPITDMQLQRVSLLSDEGDPDIRILLTIRNQGTLAMSDFAIAITLDHVLTIHKRFEGNIGPGETVNYPLDFTVSAQLNQAIDLHYICATLEEQAEDINISNNRSCLSLDDNFSVLTPYPNPSASIFKVDMVLPQQEIVQLSLLDIEGALLQNLRFDNTKVGLNTFTIDVSTMVPGNYVLLVNYPGHTETHRLMVGP